MQAPLHIDDPERLAVDAALKRRYGMQIEVQIVEVELRPTGAASDRRTYPSLYWEARCAAFVICKIGVDQWRPFFFYPGDPAAEQYGTAQPQFNDLLECVMAVLRLQADHEKIRHGIASGDSATDFVQTDQP